MPKGQPPDLLQLAGSAVRLARALERGLDEALGPDLPLTGREYLLLRVLRQGFDNPSDVARELEQPPANVSRAIRRLTELELLERSVNPADQRRALLRLTPVGEATVDFAMGRVTAWLQALFGRSSDEWLAGTQQRLTRLVELATTPRPSPPATSWSVHEFAYVGLQSVGVESLVMPLFRKDPFGRAWVLLSPERGLEPSDFGSVPPAPATSPLSPGEEERVGAEIAAVRPATSAVDQPDWRIRALTHPAGMVSNRPGQVDGGSALFRQAPALGYHELIVEHPDARERLETMGPSHLTEVLRFYRDRVELAASRPGIRHVQVTRNVGRAAGALYEHPHGQLLAVPVTNRWVEEEAQVAAEHHREHGSCLFCDVIEHETNERERVVTENDAFVALTPFASKTPFETWILPKQHASSFANVPANSLPQLADILQVVVRGLVDALDNPPYNLTLHTGVAAGSPDFHWHIEVLPRLTNQAGFDWGTGFFVNPTLPEDAARFLREAVALQEVMR